MGSDLSFEDLTNRTIDKYEYPTRPLVVDCKYNDEDKKCYELKSIPKNKKNSEYAYHKTNILEIEKNIFIAISEKSYDKSEKLLKIKNIIYDLIQHTKQENFYVMSQLNVENVQKNSNTKLFVEKISLNNDFPENLFQERSLKRLP